MSSDDITTFLETNPGPVEDLSGCDCGGSVLTAEQDFTSAAEGYNVYWDENEHE